MPKQSNMKPKKTSRKTPLISFCVGYLLGHGVYPQMQFICSVRLHWRKPAFPLQVVVSWRCCLSQGWESMSMSLCQCWDSMWLDPVQSTQPVYICRSCCIWKTHFLGTLRPFWLLESFHLLFSISPEVRGLMKSPFMAEYPRVSLCTLSSCGSQYQYPSTASSSSFSDAG